MSDERILIIDDEANLRATMSLALETEGYRIEGAPDGPAGLQLFGAGDGWDLVLLDQRMPGMEGLEVLRRIRERDPAARVMMVTAYGTIELAVDAMKAGAADFLRKPFTPEVLRGAVRSALEQPRAPITDSDPQLTRLLPRLPPPAPHRDLPHIYFRTLNGFKFWPVPIPDEENETEALRVRRVFDVRSHTGETRRCTVDLTTSVRGLVRDATGHDYPATDPIWDTVCKSALSAHLWETAEMPPQNLMVYGLNREQLDVVRAMAGLTPERMR